jgi:phenylalanyl-tRNA synthetase beta chain
MLVPISWLKQLVEIPDDLNFLTDRLTYAGHMLDKQTKIGDDTVIDLELRGNREDLFGIIGIAREVHALFGKPLNLPPEPNWNDLPHSKLETRNSKLDIHVQATNLVNRFYSLEITNLQIQPSPDWLQQMLKKVNINPVNNVVDATNYIMYLTAQPLHAFDVDQIHSHQLILRQGKAEETFTTFEGHQIKVNSEDLVASDPQKCLGFLGVIGEKTSGVSQKTKTVLLEGGNYHQVNIRHTRIRHKLPTEAALRLEKNIDPTLPPYAVKLCAQLICELAQGQIIPNSWQDYQQQDYTDPWKTISFNPTAVKRLSGITISDQQIIKIFNLLDLPVRHPEFISGSSLKPDQILKQVQKDATNNWQVDIPWRRSDIEGEADLVEEVLRVYGYQEIPAQPITDPVPQPIEPPHIQLQEKIRDILVHMDFKENLSDSFTSQKQQKLFFGNKPHLKPITLINPISPETALLRTSLLPAQINFVQQQINKQKKQLTIFEISRVYWQPNQEQIYLAGAYYDTTQDLSQIYQQFLSKFEKLLKHLQIFDYHILPHANHPLLYPNQSIIIKQDQISLVQLGFLNKKIANRLNLATPILLFESEIDNLLKANTKIHTVTASPHPPIYEDLSFTFPSQTHISPVIEAIKHQSQLVKQVELIDTHNQDRAFRIIYQSTEQNLSSTDIKPLRQKIIKTIESQFQAKLKGQA